MKSRNLDVVYFVKESTVNEELRYSLRSVEKNLKHNRVWIFGGCPVRIQPDIYVKVKQPGTNKWDNVRMMFKMACQNKELTDNFILFNDDFFVMKPTDEIKTIYRATLEEHIEILKRGYGGKLSSYAKLLRDCKRKLENLDKPTLSYELHTPFIFNKRKLLKLLETYPEMHCNRTMYGNVYKIGGKQHGDIKIFSVDTKLDYKNSQFLSTDDGICNVNNEIWMWLRSQFRDKSQYEL